MTATRPGEVEIYGSFSRHVGPRYLAAGLRVQFHYNQIPGIHFKAAPPEEYRAAILRGLQEGLAHRFPEFPASASVWVLEVSAHEVDSCEMAFYQAARMVIEQAFFLVARPQA